MKKTNKRVQEFIRVDHAGERGALNLLMKVSSMFILG